MLQSRHHDHSSSDSVTAPDARPIKRILVVMYSQSGQLQRIVMRMLEPLLDDARFAVHIEPLQLARDFPFPWSLRRFFDAFPESALMCPPPLAALSLSGDEDFDLIILPYQVWFLAPSQPICAFLQDPRAQRLLTGKPVVTLVACRNMWLLAQEKLKTLLRAANARLIDHVALTDPSSTLSTLITTPLWLLTGKRRPLRWLPPAGISETDIAASIRFGQALREGLLADREKTGEALLRGLGAVKVQPQLLSSERAGTRSFQLWGRLLRCAGPEGSWQRVPLLLLYALFLLALIISVVPASLSIQTLLRPVLRRRLAAIEQHFESPSGSGTERLTQHEL
jgi:hypothetical protein